MKKLLVILLSCLMLVTGCTKPNEPKPAYNEEFDKLCREWFVEDMESDYLSAHYTVADLSKYGITKPEVTIGELETAEDDTTIADRLAKLETVSYESLSDDQKITYDSLKFYYTLQKQYQDLETDYDFVFTPNSGLNNNLITNFTEFVFRSEEDVNDFIVLLNDTGRIFDEGIEYTKKQVEDGVVQSQYSIDEVIEQCSSFISSEGENEIIRSFGTKVTALNLAKEEEYKSQVKEAVMNVVIPAYKRVIDYFKTLNGKSTINAGLCRYDGGKEYYELLFKDNCSTSRTVDEVYDELLLRINRALDLYIDGLAQYSEESYNQDDVYAILELIKTKMVDEYPAMADVDYTCEFLDPTVTSDNVAAYYVTAAVDDFKNNVIKVNPTFVKSDPNGICTTLAHEGYPGHLYQHTYYLNTHPNNEIRSVLDFGAYTEGWAMYVEGYSTYYFTNKYTARCDDLWNQLWYYWYGLVDIQIHYLDYSVEDIAEYFENFFYPEDAKSIAESLYDSTVAEPCMFLPYSIGLLEMTTLRDKAEKALGSNFSAKEYNQVILDCGPTSYEILSQQVDKYIGK